MGEGLDDQRGNLAFFFVSCMFLFTPSVASFLPFKNDVFVAAWSLSCSTVL